MAIPVSALPQKVYFPAQETLQYVQTTNYCSVDEQLTLNSSIFQHLTKEEILKNAIINYYYNHIERRIRKLSHSAELKLKKQTDAFKAIDLNLVRYYTALTSSYCLLTQPNKIAIDVTSDPSVFFTLKYENKKNAYLEIFFDNENEGQIQLNANIYQDKELVFAYGGEYLNTFKAFLKQVPININIEI